MLLAMYIVQQKVGFSQKEWKWWQFFFMIRKKWNVDRDSCLLHYSVNLHEKMFCFLVSPNTLQSF